MKNRLMKTLLVVPGALLAGCLAALGGGGGEIPEELALSRYQGLMEKSPFALATPPVEAPPPVETASFARDFYITGIAQMGERPFVTFSSKDKQTFFSLGVGESFEGMTLTAVEWQPEVGKSTATLERQGEQGVVRFDEVAIHTAPVVQATPAPPQPQQEQQGEGRRRWSRGDGGGNGWFNRGGGGGEGRGWSRRGRAIPAPNQ